MPAIRTGARTLELAGNSQLALERNSPLLSNPDEVGSTSLAFRLPRTPANDRTLGQPARFDHRAGQAPQLLDVEAIDDMGNGITTGNLRYRGVEPAAYLYNLEFGDSAAMAKLKARTLQQFRFGGPRTLEPPGPRDPSELSENTIQVARYMEIVLANPAQYDFCFAPFSNNDHAGQWASIVEGIDQVNSNAPAGTPLAVAEHTNNFNTWAPYFHTAPQGTYGFSYPISFSIGLPFQTNATAFYDYVKPCPLPKVEYVVRTIFQELQLPFVTDVFENPDMAQLVFVPAAGVINGKVTDQPGYTYIEANFHIGDHLPKITAAQLIRKLMNTFGWHFDTLANGTCRLLQAAPLVLDGNPIDITTLTGPDFTSEPQDPSSLLVKPSLAENDQMADDFGEQPDPASIQAPVATVADLPAPAAAEVYRLVRSVRRYYKTTADTTTEVGTGATLTVYRWEPGPYYLPGVIVGTAENQDEYEIPATTCFTTGIDFSGQANNSRRCDTLCFLEKADPSAAISPNLRLAFYRGLQPMGFNAPNGQPAMVPWLSQRHVGPRGTIIGNLSLEAHGQYGLVKKCLYPLLALKTASTIVKFPALFTSVQFTQLDFSQMVAIRGDEFMVRRLSLSFPIIKAGQLELVPRAQVERVPMRTDVPEDYTSTVTPGNGLTCDLRILTVQQNADVATVLVDQQHGTLKYQLNTGPLQDSNVFSGLVTGHYYVFWVYDMGVTGCHKMLAMTW